MARTTTGIRYRHSRSCTDRDRCKRDCGGAWEASVYSKRDGKKIRRTFPTHAAAKGWRTDALKQVKDRKLRAPTPKTLRQEADEWLELARQGAVLSRSKERYKPGVLRTYEIGLRLRVLPELGHRRLSDISVGDMLALKEGLLAAGHGASTVRNTFIPLQAIFRRAVLNGTVPLNPTLGLDLPTSNGTRDRVASPGEAKQLLEALPERERALWATAFYAGLRRGELRALRAENVDLDAGVIHVVAGWDDKEGEIEPKSKRGKRDALILAPLRPYLIDHLTLTARSGADLVFGSTPTTPFSPKNVAKKAARAWAKANAKRGENNEPLLQPIGLHEARHTCVSYMSAAGIPLDRIGPYVGHSSTYMTERYRHLIEGHEEETAKAVNEYLALADTAKRLAQVEGAPSEPALG
jgi:integrase